MSFKKSMKEKIIWSYYTLVSPIYDHSISRDEPCLNLREYFMEKLGIKDTSKIIECGSGPGTNIKYYPDNVELHIIDTNGIMIQIARSRAKKISRDNIEFYQQDARYLNCPDNCMDIGVLTYALSAIIDNELALSQIERIVKPGGSIGIIDFNKPPSYFPGIASLDLEKLLSNRDRSTIKSHIPLEYNFLSSKQSIYILEVI